MNEYNKVNDSGERQEFETGSRRDTRKGKGRFDLLPADCIKRLAQHYENGAEKYGDNNWKLGQPSSRYIDSGLRHFFAYLHGDRSEDHLMAVVFNAFGIAYNEMNIPHMHDLDDGNVES
jgi:hypothetical protein